MRPTLELRRVTLEEAGKLEDLYAAVYDKQDAEDREDFLLEADFAVDRRGRLWFSPRRSAGPWNPWAKGEGSDEETRQRDVRFVRAHVMGKRRRD